MTPDISFITDTVSQDTLRIGIDAVNKASEVVGQDAWKYMATGKLLTADLNADHIDPLANEILGEMRTNIHYPTVWALTNLCHMADNYAEWRIAYEREQERAEEQKRFWATWCDQNIQPDSNPVDLLETFFQQQNAREEEYCSYVHQIENKITSKLGSNDYQRIDTIQNFIGGANINSYTGVRLYQMNLQRRAGTGPATNC